MSTEVIEAEATPIGVANFNTTAIQHKAEVEAQVDTAHKYPRSIAAFLSDSLAMATVDAETAGSMFYRVPRAGKFIEGPSARLAEIVATAWGNLRFGARIIDVGPTMLTAQGFCFDCQKNTGITVEIQRRITDKAGKRFADDMIVVTGNAACSIALRNAVFKVVPRAYVDQIMKKAKQVAIGDAKSLSERRENAFGAIRKLGVTDDRILAVVGKPSIKDITLDDVDNLAGLFSAVRNDEISIDDAFPEITEDTEDSDKPKKTSAKGAAAKAKEKLGIQSQEPEKAPQNEPEPVSTPQVTVTDGTTEEFNEEFNRWSLDQQTAYKDAHSASISEGSDREDAHIAGYKAATRL